MRHAIMLFTLIVLADSKVMAAPPLSAGDLYYACNSSDTSLQEVCSAFISGYIAGMHMGYGLAK
jgi:hypothetical protein